MKRKGTVVQVTGPVVDVAFDGGSLPEINEALTVAPDGQPRMMEVAQHIGGDTVRCIMLSPSEGGFTPFNRGSLPVVSGIAIEVKEENGGFTLTGIKRDGKPLREDETVTVTCLATAGGMAPLLADESRAFEGGDTTVRDTWSAYVSGGNAALAEPENYTKLR